MTTSTTATPEELAARIAHLSALAELLPEFAATSSGAWLYREITREARRIAAIATEYVLETERAGLSASGGTTPEVQPWQRPPADPYQAQHGRKADELPPESGEHA